MQDALLVVRTVLHQNAKRPKKGTASTKDHRIPFKSSPRQLRRERSRCSWPSVVQPRNSCLKNPMSVQRSVRTADGLLGCRKPARGSEYTRCCGRCSMQPRTAQVWRVTAKSWASNFAEAPTAKGATRWAPSLFRVVDREKDPIRIHAVLVKLRHVAVKPMLQRCNLPTLRRPIAESLIQADNVGAG